MEKLSKLSLPTAILVSSVIFGGVFYATQINKQQSIERQLQIKIEQENKKQRDEEIKEQQVKDEEQQVKEDGQRALSLCMDEAETNYENMWYNECKAQGKLTAECIELRELSPWEYLKKHGLTIEQLAKKWNITGSSEVSVILEYARRRRVECFCRLPIDPFIKLFDKRLADNKGECLRKHPQK